MSMQARLTNGLVPALATLDLALDRAVLTAAPLPIRHGFVGNFILLGGDRLIVRSVPAPDVASILSLRFQFVDIEQGEYIASL